MGRGQGGGLFFWKNQGGPGVRGSYTSSFIAFLLRNFFIDISRKYFKGYQTSTRAAKGGTLLPTPTTQFKVWLLLRYHCGSAYNWKPQEGAVNTNIYDNGDVFCESVNPEILISLLTKNPCHIDNTFSLFSLLLLQLPWFACWTYYRSLLTIMSVKPMCGVLGK